MALPARTLRALAQCEAAEAWPALVERALDIARRPLAADNAPSEVVKRDREIGELDLFLASSGWDLWHAFGDGVERTSQRLQRWWQQPYSAKAVLILDALSLRELPWLLQGAVEHGFTVHEVGACASELPGETNEFARALGFTSRSQLQNNGGGLGHRLQPANTESVDLPWRDCEALVNRAPGATHWVFWHHWPDTSVHDYGTGQGLERLTKEAAQQLLDADFWRFVARLAQGRRLVITSDHGYAATSYFRNEDGEVAKTLRQMFAGGRGKPGAGDTGPFAPPVALQIEGPHGVHRLALGRRRWPNPSGYPMLTHGGLSLLEVLSPYVELTRAGD